MNNQDKISLSDLNKQKKSSAKSQLKLKNPFKKQKGPARDDEGKFTAGSGGLLSGKKLNLSRMLPVILVVALVGGIFVFRSFAATSKPPAYQYSITTCLNSKLPTDDKLSTEQKKCIDESAEATSYRMALALVGTENDWAYKTYTQKLAGDRITVPSAINSLASVNTVKFAKMTDKAYVDTVASAASAATRAEWTKEIANKKLTREKLAENIAALYKTSKNKVQLGTYRLNNQQFIQNIYTNLLGNKANITANNWWVQQLDKETWSRERVVQHIIGLADAKNASRGKLIAYANAKPKVKITQTAKAKQAAREKQLKTHAASAKSYYEKSVKSHADAVAKNIKTMTSLANKAVPSANDLNTATKLNGQTQDHAKKAATSRNRIKTLVSKGAKIYGESSKLSKYATDISSTKAQSYMKEIYSYNNKAVNATNKANQQAKTATSKLAAVKSKRAAEEKRIAAVRAAEQASQGGGSGGTPQPATTTETTTGLGLIKSYTDCMNKKPQTVTVNITGGRRKVETSYKWNQFTSPKCSMKKKTTTTCDTTQYKPSGERCIKLQTVNRTPIGWVCPDDTGTLTYIGMGEHGTYRSCKYRYSSGDVIHKAPTSVTCPSPAKQSPVYTSPKGWSARNCIYKK